MDEEKVYVIPTNFDGGWVTGGGKGLGHVLEAAFFTALIVVPIILLSFDMKIKMLLITLLGLPTFIFILRGKNGCLMSEYFRDYIKFRRSIKEMKRCDKISET